MGLPTDLKSSHSIFKPASGELEKLVSMNNDVDNGNCTASEQCQLKNYGNSIIRYEDETFVPEGYCCDNTGEITRRWGVNDAVMMEDYADEEDEDGDNITSVIDGLDDLDVLGDFVESTGYRGDLTKHVQALRRSGKAVRMFEKGLERRRENWSRDKVNRATVEQVLDPRTRTIIFKLLGRGRLTTMGGCVSTGKEANVYYGTVPVTASENDTGEYGTEAVAVKIFKTSILQFKDRERYVDGEHRFSRQGYNRSSPRKMVQQWAEKEFRNLARLRTAGIRAPKPLILKPPVLVMTFFGRDGWPAPKLKDAGLSVRRLYKCYDQVVNIMRRMWKSARLVHGDLSEYNMLYDMGQVIVIDVSQSVEGDHPMALDFLRRDCMHVNDFFRRSNVDSLLSLRELFEYVTTNEDGDLDALRAASTAHGDTDDKQKLDDAVFAASHIPQSLKEVDSLTWAEQAAYHELREGLVNGKEQEDGEEEDEEGKVDEVEDHSSTAAEDEDGEENSEEHVSEKQSEMSTMSRKEWKKKVKAEARERRRNKTPKQEKKRKKTLAKRRKGMKTKK